jgi:hypothetical protein
VVRTRFARLTSVSGKATQSVPNHESLDVRDTAGKDGRRIREPRWAGQPRSFVLSEGHRMTVRRLFDLGGEG